MDAFQQPTGDVLLALYELSLKNPQSFAKNVDPHLQRRVKIAGRKAKQTDGLMYWAKISGYYPSPAL